MKIAELVAALKADNEKLFGPIPDKRAANLVRAVLQKVSEQIDATEEGKLFVGGLGNFVVRNVPSAEGSAPERRVIFRKSKPAKAKSAKAAE